MPSSHTLRATFDWPIELRDANFKALIFSVSSSFHWHTKYVARRGFDPGMMRGQKSGKINGISKNKYLFEEIYLVLAKLTAFLK